VSVGIICNWKSAGGGGTPVQMQAKKDFGVNFEEKKSLNMKL